MHRTKTVSSMLFAALAVLAAGTVTRAADAPAAPSAQYGVLYYEVQMRRIFPDGKVFADAVPREDPNAILAEFLTRERLTDEELRQFVATRFDLPSEPQAKSCPPTTRPSLTAHIAQLWPTLMRNPGPVPAGSSALPLDQPYVVPGGRFREIYYWDSYFTLLGLNADHQDAAVLGMVADFGDLIRRYGRVPNGTRTYYLTRSQPPVFYLMAAMADAINPRGAEGRLQLMRKEYAFWMDGENRVAPGQTYRRVVRLADGALLNRYADDGELPRDESFREDILTARRSQRPAAETYRDLRSAAESGWDFSSRWLGDDRDLASIQTTSILPVDLNSLLFGLETAISGDCGRLGDERCREEFALRAAARRRAINAYFWNAKLKVYGDFNWKTRTPTNVLSAASVFPLFTVAADMEKAKATSRTLGLRLLAPGGLRTTDRKTGQQWDAPNGWAPLQWAAVVGLRNYGEGRLACEIAGRWIRTVAREYESSGKILEKYDVEIAGPGGGGEYPLQDGFGWTNGVTRALLAIYPGAQGSPSPRCEGIG